MDNPATVLVMGGKTGLLGQAVSHAFSRKKWRVTGAGSADLDLFDPSLLSALVDKVEPSVVVNAIGYTHVDRAEDEPDLAMRLNRSFPALLAKVLKGRPVTLVHYSTDFVFDGKKDVPYQTQDATNPLSVYGKSKLAGEQALADSGLDTLLILRTAWLYGPWKTNFIRKILELCTDRSELSVVHDQVGSPTYTLDLADYTVALIEKEATGLFHVVNTGKASWCELATEAVSLSDDHCRILPIQSRQFPQKAIRPPYSVLDTADFTRVTGIRPRAWNQSLRDYIFRE